MRKGEIYIFIYLYCKFYSKHSICELLKPECLFSVRFSEYIMIYSAIKLNASIIAIKLLNAEYEVAEACVTIVKGHYCHLLSEFFLKWKREIYQSTKYLFIASASSESSDESVHMCRLIRASTVR